jgi:heme oxygenase
MHRALDCALMPDGTAWTRTRYVQFLRATLAVVGGVETTLADLVPGFAAAADTTRAVRLRHDLHALREAAPTPPPIPIDVPDLAAGYGAAYVIEGSMLGGQHVALALERDLNLDRACLTYLRPPGTAAGPRWAAFVAALDAFGVRASAIEWRMAERTARTTFAAFTQAFRREGLIA